MAQSTSEEPGSDKFEGLIRPDELRKIKGSTSPVKDNLYVCSILAVHVDTGQLAWHYQVVPADAWDFVQPEP